MIRVRTDYFPKLVKFIMIRYENCDVLIGKKIKLRYQKNQTEISHSQSVES